MEKKMYTTTEAMKFFGVSRTSVIALIEKGFIEAEKEKGKWIIDGQSMKEWKELQASGFRNGTEAAHKRLERGLEKHMAENEKRREQILKQAAELTKNGTLKP